MDLSGKIALVTGASGGLGRAIALELAGRGADVVVHCVRHVTEAREVAEGVTRQGRRAVVVRGDVRRVEEVDAMVAEGVAALGGLDILVNNAGVAEQTAPPWDLAAWEHLVAVNLTGKFLCARAARQYLTERQGVVVNISSTSAYNPTYGYGVTKVGVNGLTYWLAQEMAPCVRVVGVAPGYIEAGFNGDHSPEIRQKVAAKTLLGRNGTASDVARAVAWLAGPEAGFITGETLMVGGGIHLRL